MLGRETRPALDSDGSRSSATIVRDAAPARREPPLTIREVVRRSRERAEELDRLHGEIDALRRRAEAAERRLDAEMPRAAVPIRSSRAGARSRPATTRWAAAVVLPEPAGR